jgi:hypothetical protein
MLTGDIPDTSKWKRFLASDEGDAFNPSYPLALRRRALLIACSGIGKNECTEFL